jgi:alpha-L-fucosidase
MGDEFSPSNVLSSDENTYWRTKERTESAEITLRFDSAKRFNMVVLMEHIASSDQRIEDFTLECEEGADWKEIFHGTVVGCKKICRFPAVNSKAILLHIGKSRLNPTLARFQVFFNGISF